MAKEVEILIINDGSKDNTARIVTNMPVSTIIRAIHQENKVMGGAVNTGMANATGKYFKVVDGIWVDVHYANLEQLQRFENWQKKSMCSLNFVYEKKARKQKIMRYTSAFLKIKCLLGDDAKPLRRGKYMMMHSLIYNMNLLRNRIAVARAYFLRGQFICLRTRFNIASLYTIYRYLIGRESIREREGHD